LQQFWFRDQADWFSWHHLSEVMMKMTSVVSVLLCSVILMPSMAQNLKGSVAEATSADSVSKEAEGQLKYEASSVKIV